MVLSGGAQGWCSVSGCGPIGMTPNGVDAQMAGTRVEGDLYANFVNLADVRGGQYVDRVAGGMDPAGRQQDRKSVV